MIPKLGHKSILISNFPFLGSFTLGKSICHHGDIQTTLWEQSHGDEPRLPASKQKQLPSHLSDSL